MRKSLRRAAALGAALLMGGTLAGCSSVVQNPPATAAPAATQAAAAAAPAAAAPAAPAANVVSGSTNDAPPQPLSGAKITLRVSHPESDTNMLNTWNCYARVFKNSIEVYSGGEITCAIYPNDQLGDLTSCIEQCSQGTLDICLSPGSGNLATWVPDLACFDIPYLIDDTDTANLVLQGPVVDMINEQLAPKANMKLMSIFTTGFRNIDSYTKPIHKVEDMKGLKFRLQNIDAHIAMGEAWGAVPTTVAFSELYSAASTGVIDASDNCNYTLFMKNLEEVTKYITDTAHVANVVSTMISTKTLDKLTPDQQNMIFQAAADARRATIGVVQASNVYNTQKLLDAGVELISLTPAERQEFRDACFDYVCDKILPTVDEGFYNNFLESYEAAKTALGKN